MLTSLPSSMDYRTEKIFHVPPAVSVKNIYSGINIPQNPGMGANNFNSGHQDSYCSESVGLPGPTSKRVRLITQYHPYGLVGVMTCNSKNQMIGVGMGETGFTMIVFDSECRIISATKLGNLTGDFTGGYFYMDKNDNAIVTTGTSLLCYPTGNVEEKPHVYPLNPVWTSDNIVKLVTGAPDGNSVYASLPVWGETDLYWFLLAGDYDMSSLTYKRPAYMAVVKIVPDSRQPTGCTTTLITSLKFDFQFNNNTFAVDEECAYFVTNSVDNTTKKPSDKGYLHCVKYDRTAKKISLKWSHSHASVDYYKPGLKNFASGTTPTLAKLEDGTKIVTIADNANPQTNVLVYKCDNGELLSTTPVFSKMRSGDEASLINVRDRIIVENNFGHIVKIPFPQLVSNEPGISLIKASPAKKSAEIIWDNYYTTAFGMSMLARESGVIFAFSASWYDSISNTEGPEYNVSAIDAHDGRVIWRVPVGRGFNYCHEYGGIYFNRTGTSLYVGANRYLISIQDTDPRLSLPGPKKS